MSNLLGKHYARGKITWSELLLHIRVYRIVITRGVARPAALQGHKFHLEFYRGGTAHVYRGMCPGKTCLAMPLVSIRNYYIM